MKFKSTPIRLRELKTGDIFSVAIAKKLNKMDAPAVSVFVKTDQPFPDTEVNQKLHKLTIE